MSRLNLTLDKETFARLGKRARQEGAPRAALARRLVQEGLDQRETLERRRKLAADYTAGRADAKDLLRDFEASQLDLLADEDNA